MGQTDTDLASSVCYKLACRFIQPLTHHISGKYFYNIYDGRVCDYVLLLLLCRCAGVCSYEGHGGLCSIRLSEPLLKFRPRKDLIETLLVCMVLHINNNIIVQVQYVYRGSSYVTSCGDRPITLF